jgi:hypothetical protein
MISFVKMAVFWVAAPRSLVEVYQRFRGTYCFRREGDGDGDSKDLWNVGKRLPDYTPLQPKRQPSSYSPPWAPQILLISFTVSLGRIRQLSSHK